MENVSNQSVLISRCHNVANMLMIDKIFTFIEYMTIEIDSKLTSEQKYRNIVNVSKQ